jgi:predicted ATPase
MQRKIVSEMVGRGREAELLESLIKKLIGGKGSLVNIVGKAGIGKSRLMDEIKVQPIMEKVLLLEGRAMSTGQNLSFHPITNLIKSWAGITEDDIPSASSEKLFQGIKLNTPEQADEIYSYLATMMGLPLEGKYKERVKGIEGEALEKLILKNLRDLIISATKNKPRIYLIEDMHWADSSSLTMFESLYKLSQKYPVMFINVLRPGYKETGDYILKWLVDNLPGDNITITVSPLEEKESGELISNLLKKNSLPEKVAATIIRKTEGNPFFIEEVIRSFLDDGIIEIKEKEFIVTERINEVNIPETINDVILSRVDKLDEKTRELLNTASVMGRNFYYKVLEEATDTIEELDDRLAYLSEVQLITESKKKQDIEYLFKHALAQQLTYDSIIQQSRKGLHLKIAASIEKVFAENINEFYGTLAYHYTKAENNEKTIQYLILARDESMKSGASAEALNFYKDALDNLPEKRKQDVGDIEIRDLEFKTALAYHAIGKNIESRECFEVIASRYFGYHFTKSKYPLMIKGIYGMFKFMVIINNQKLYFKREVDDDFQLLTRVIRHWGESIATFDPRTFALNGFHFLVYLSRYQLQESIHGLTVFAESSSMYMWTGISFDVSNKMLEYARMGSADQDPVSRATYRFCLKMHDFMTGKWEEDSDY